MAYKLVVADVVEVPVKFSVNDGGRQATFSFSLTADRLSQDDFRRMAADDGDTTVAEFLAGHISGWRGQRLVIDDDGEPAAFSAEALACMLGLVGLAAIVLGAYIEACGAQGKAKN